MESPKGYEDLSPREEAIRRFELEIPNRLELWDSVIDDSTLNAENKNRFKKVLRKNKASIKTTDVGSYLEEIVKDLYQAVVYSWETIEAMAVYKNLEADIRDFRRELYDK